MLAIERTRRTRSGISLSGSLAQAAFLALVASHFPVTQLTAANLVPIPALGVTLASGFRISVYAGPDLANDIYAMTLDAAGNVTVTSQGYIKKLEDNARVNAVRNDGKRRHGLVRGWKRSLFLR